MRRAILPSIVRRRRRDDEDEGTTKKKDEEKGTGVFIEMTPVPFSSPTIWGAVAAAVVAGRELLGNIIYGVLDFNVVGIAYGTTVMLWVGGALAWNVSIIRCFMIGHRKLGIASALLLTAWWCVLLWHFMGLPDLT